jgi:hypothetical protein
MLQGNMFYLTDDGILTKDKLLSLWRHFIAVPVRSVLWSVACTELFEAEFRHFYITYFFLILPTARSLILTQLAFS